MTTGFAEGFNTDSCSPDTCFMLIRDHSESEHN